MLNGASTSTCCPSPFERGAENLTSPMTAKAPVSENRTATLLGGGGGSGKGYTLESIGKSKLGVLPEEDNATVYINGDSIQNRSPFFRAEAASKDPAVS